MIPEGRGTTIATMTSSMANFNRRMAMKSIVYTHCLTALALGVAVAFTSCNKVESELPVDDGTLTIEFQQVDAENATRTEFHENTIWWSKDDKVTFIQYAMVNDKMTYKSTPASVSSAKEKISFSISNFNTPDEGTDSYYYSIYPTASFKSYNTTTGHVRPKITTPDTQTPTATSFDPAADLLISNVAENLTKNSAGKYVVQLAYYRQVAIGKMRIKNLPSTSPIASVEFSAEHDGSSVTLAGEKWYDFTTQAPSSVASRKYNLILDYSAQEIAGDMTAYFCCYPFELDADDTFMVKVVTKAGEEFTRIVTLPASRTLSFEADRGTQFTVDMSKATKNDDWLSVNEYSSSTYTKTATKVYYTIKKTSAQNAVSGKFLAVSEEVFAGIDNISAYLDQKGTSMNENSLASINSSGTSYISNTPGLKPDSWNVVMCKLVLENETVGVAITRIKTDWFSMTAQTRSSGGISFYYYGANLVSATRNYRAIATDALPEGTSFEDYYTSTLAPGGISTETLDAINSAGANGKGYYTTKYHTGKSTTAPMTPGTNYTFMIKAVNERGETKFVTASADAGGSTN